MRQAIFYNSAAIFRNEADKQKRKSIPGAELFNCLFHVFGYDVSFLDRTGTLENPINSHVLPFMKTPALAKSKPFEHICNERALELLKHANATNRSIAVMYSGGIDSTLVLTALLKNGTKEDLKRITVLLSENSIEENPKFYENQIVKNFRCVSSYNFPYYIGNDQHILVSGEHGDQLFGSMITNAFTNAYGKGVLYSEVNDGILIDFLRSKLPVQSHKFAERLYQELKKVTRNATVNIETVYQFFWWLNFATKWQNVYVRLLPYSMRLSSVKFEDNYTTFFSSTDFQLWSMNNYQSFGSSPGIAKHESKKYIIDLTGDLDFMTKPKLGSLYNLMIRQSPYYLVDSGLNLVNSFPGKTFINYRNSFI